ncbi:MAG: GNAT family N-acetyltransferase [Paracoccaceae bacterium]
MQIGRGRRLGPGDITAALNLYAVLEEVSEPGDPDAFLTVLNHPGTDIYGVFEGDALRAMATLHLLPNVTRNARPYALIENVVTATGHRRRGFARAVLETCIQASRDGGAYKIMLLTGQAKDSIGFYKKVGFRDDDKFGLTIRFP